MSASMNKNILTVMFNTFPDKGFGFRVQKACEGLLDAGYNVRVLAIPGKTVGTRWEGRVENIKNVSYILRKLDGLLNKLLSRLRPGFLSGRAYTGLLTKCIRREKITAVYWNSFNMVHIGLTIAHKMNVRFIVDFQENYPYNLWSTERDLGIVSSKYSLSDLFRYEKYIVDRADMIVTTVAEMSERLHGMHFTPHSKMTDFMNAETPEFWDKQPQLSTPLDAYPDRDIVLYCGSCSVHRGLDIIIEALPQVINVWPNILFAIVGDGNSIPKLKEMVKRKKLEKYVLFFGHRPFAEMAAYMRQSVIGIVPHHKYGQTDNTVPHKLFQYMCFSKPVLVSSCACLRRLVEESHSGLVFQAGNYESAAEKLLVLKDESLRDRLGKNGRAACEGPYNLKIQQRRLIGAVTNLLKA